MKWRSPLPVSREGPAGLRTGSSPAQGSCAVSRPALPGHTVGLRALLAFAFCAFASACSGDAPTSSGVQKPATPSQVVVASGDSQTGTAGAKLADPLVVKVTDASGKAVSGTTVTWAVAEGGGTLSAPSSTTDVHGQARIEWTLGTTVGVNRATATVGSLTAATFIAKGTAGEAAKLEKVSGDGQEGSAGSTLAEPLVVKATDANGNPVRGASVSWAVTGGGGSLSAASSTTDSAGVTRAQWILGTTTAPDSATASLASGPGVAFHAMRTAEPPAFSLAGVSVLVPGDTAEVTGTALDRLTALSVDGQPVTPFEVSGGTARFVVPQMRSCETDGREVQVRASADTANRSLNATIKVPSVVALRAGEVRVLSRTEIEGCLQLPAADHDYVLQLVNPTISATSTMRTMASVRSWTGGAAALSRSPSRSPTSSGPLPEGSSDYVRPASNSVQPTFAASPTPFDPEYATAQVGDTVRFVDWKVPGGVSCSTVRDSAPYYEAVVVGVAGKTVIVLDLRNAGIKEQLADSAWYARGARGADPLLIPTSREVFDPAFETLKGGGGRFFAIVSDRAGNAGVSSDGGTGGLQSQCALASEMVTVMVGAHSNRTAQMSRNLANILVHEFAHNAHWITDFRHGYRTYGTVWTEPFAVVAEGEALRIALNQSEGVDYSDWFFTGEPENVPATTAGRHCRWGRCVDFSFSTWTNPGWYSYGATLVHLAREIFGDAPLGRHGPGGKTLLQAFGAHSTRSGNPGTDLTQLAAAIGMSGSSLFEMFTVTDVIDDLMAPAVASAEGHRLLRSFDTPRGRGFPPARVYSRTADATHTLKAGAGTYAAAFLFAEAGRGVSLEISGVTSEPMVARLIRLR